MKMAIGVLVGANAFRKVVLAGLLAIALACGISIAWIRSTGGWRLVDLERMNIRNHIVDVLLARRIFHRIQSSKASSPDGHFL